MLATGQFFFMIGHSNVDLLAQAPEFCYKVGGDGRDFELGNAALTFCCE